MNVTSQFDEFVRPLNEEDSCDYAVHCRGLSKRYGRVLALDSLDWVVPTGAVCGVLGPNGSGKTTLLSLLCGYSRPTGGEVELLGKSPEHALPRVGSLVGEPLFWPHLSVQDNLRILASIAGADSDEADELLRVAGFGERSLLRRKFGNCSTGMRQRLGVVACLLGDPDLVILDEPTNGLDPQGIVGIRNLVRRVCQRPDGTKRTVVMASHMLREVELLCDRVCVLSAGRAVYSGPASGVSGMGDSIRLMTTDDELALCLLSGAGLECGYDPAGGLSVGGYDGIGGVAGVSRILALSEIYPTLMIPGRSLEAEFMQLMESEG